MDLNFLLELAGLFLTLVILLYLIFGDNALFRLVTYTFIGVAAGYVAVLVIFQVLVPRLLNLLFSGEWVFMVMGAVQVLLGILLLFKLSRRTSALGTLPMAILVGVGAAVAIGGAIFGTLFGQLGGTIGLFNLRAGGDPLARLLEGVFVLLGTITTLAYFQFSVRSRAAPADPETTARRAFPLELLAKVGQVFIGITLGAMFAGVYTAAISALIERIGFIFDVTFRLFAGG
jgi:hypothetical protein